MSMIFITNSGDHSLAIARELTKLPRFYIGNYYDTNNPHWYQPAMCDDRCGIFLQYIRADNKYRVEPWMGAELEGNPHLDLRTNT